MSEFGPVIAAAVEATCQAGVEEAAEGLGRALDQTLEVTVGSAGSLDREALAEEMSGPGLAVVLKVEDSAAVLLLAESSGLLPEWYSAPDATGVSKLATLAQELGMILLPEDFMPSEFLASHVENMGEALDRGELDEEVAYLPLTLTAGETSGTLHMIWPATQPDAIIDSAKSEQSPEPSAETPTAAAGTPGPTSAPAQQGPATVEESMGNLPNYSRSLLRIQVPVVVTLATTKQPLYRILELGNGSIIQFEKSCDETLTLEVGDQNIAEGEAVKVGEKFGLRVTSITMPEERFWSVRGTREKEA